MFSNLLQINTPGQVHPTRVDLQDVHTGLNKERLKTDTFILITASIFISLLNGVRKVTCNHLFPWRRELNLSVNSARSEQGVVKDIYSVSCHDDLDVLSGLKTVKLVQQLQHCPLNFTVTCVTRVRKNMYVVLDIQSLIIITCLREL